MLLLLNIDRLAGQTTKQQSKSTENLTLTTQDEWNIHITYYNPGTGQESPVVILLHMRGGNRLVWADKTGFAENLQGQGYAVISVDLRKHGQSKPAGTGKKKSNRSPDPTPVDYLRMVDQDLEAVKRFIFEQHQKKNLNMHKIAIVAPEMSAPIAIHFALLDWNKEPYPDAPTPESRTPRGQDVRALVFLSPLSSLPKLPPKRAIRELRNPEWGIAVLTCIGNKDAIDRGQARRTHQLFVGVAENEKRVYFNEYDYKLRGTDLLGKRTKFEVEGDMIGFLHKYLKELPGSWKDRRSRFQR